MSEETPLQGTVSIAAIDTMQGKYQRSQNLHADDEPQVCPSY